MLAGITQDSPMTIDFAWAPTIQGPWTTFHKTSTGTVGTIAATGFVKLVALVPALGYNILSTKPPHVRVGSSWNDYFGSLASPQMAVWDFVLGRRTYGGEAFASENWTRLISGAGYQFSDGHLTGSFPRSGLVWSFDFLDQGAGSKVTNWPFYVDRGNNSAVVTPCDNGYAATSACGYMNSGHGTSINAYGIQTNGNAWVTAVISVQPPVPILERFKTHPRRCRATDRIPLSESIVTRARRSLDAQGESGLPARYRTVTTR